MLSKKAKSIIGVRDLLELYLDFNSLTPNRNDWTEKRLHRNEPRLIRYQRLVALFRAFDIKTSIATFHEGKFIDWKNPVYRPLFARARQEMVDEIIPEAWDIDDLHFAEVSSTFETCSSIASV